MEKENKRHKNSASTSQKANVESNLKDAAEGSFKVFQREGEKENKHHKNESTTS